jgi:hypothetical protein
MANAERNIQQKLNINLEICALRWFVLYNYSNCIRNVTEMSIGVNRLPLVFLHMKSNLIE